MARIKILHFITDTDVGGTELMLTRLLPYLKQSFDTRVVCAMPRGRVGALLEAKGIPVTYLNFRHWLDIGIIYRLYRVMRDVQPDVLITHLIHSDIVGRCVGRWAGVKTIICSQQGSLLQWEFLRAFDRLTTRLVDVYIVQTEIAREELARRLRLPRSRFVVIPNSVMPHRPAGTALALRQRFGIAADDLAIICVSRLRRRKGHEFLLAAFEHVWQRNKRLALLLVGDGERLAALEQQIAPYHSRSKIFFLGNRTDVGDLLAAADIFVLPTLAEGMSNAILEAMAAGLPCLVSNIPVNKAVITAGVNGLFFKAGDVDDLADKLELLLHDAPLRHTLGRAAEAHVKQQFDPDTIAAQWVQLLRRLTA